LCPYGVLRWSWEITVVSDTEPLVFIERANIN
jgi:hypothetical protein